MKNASEELKKKKLKQRIERRIRKQLIKLWGGLELKLRWWSHVITDALSFLHMQPTVFYAHGEVFDNIATTAIWNFTMDAAALIEIITVSLPCDIVSLFSHLFFSNYSHIQPNFVPFE